MNHNENLVVKNIIEVEQPIGRFLIGILKASDLLKITHKNPRRYNEELDAYVGIQREIDQDKIEQLRKYIKTKDATFPNTIIGTLNPDNFDYDEENRVLKIKRDPTSFAIIDGQHRLASFEDEEKVAENFELIVAFFLGSDLEEQAYLFSVINMTQKKLNPSLVQDLTELFTITTPEKLAHNLAKIFNQKESSPWFKKIKMLGKAEIKYKGIISQYTFTKGIINLITDTKKYYEIRDILKKKNDNRKELKILDMDSKKYIFWDYYANEKDDLIFKILNAYFIAISRVFSEEWGNFNYILTKTTGYNAFMKFLRDLYEISTEKEALMKNEYFEKYLLRIKEKVRPLTSDNYQPGLDGEKELYEKLISQLKK